jgi:hypothetical protein
MSRNSFPHVARRLHAIARIFFQAGSYHAGQVGGEVRANLGRAVAQKGCSQPAEEAPSNGRYPVATSCSTTPKLNRSVRRSSSSPRGCV